MKYLKAIEPQDMKTKITFLGAFSLLLCLCFSPAFTQLPTLLLTAGSASNLDDMKAMVCDSKGNLIVSSHFGYPTMYDGVQIYNSSGSAHGIMIAKYDSLSVLQWMRTAETTTGSVPEELAVDAQDNIILCGRQDALFPNGTYGSLPAFPNGPGRAFIAKYDPTGTPIWLENAGNQLSSSYMDVATDPMGNVHALGTFYADTAFFQGGLFLEKRNNTWNYFVTKYSPSGNLKWIQHIYGTSNTEVKAIAADNAGNTYVCGTFGDSLILVSDTLVDPTTGDNAFIAKFDSTGNLLWSRNIEGLTASMKCPDIQIDQVGSVMITGSYMGTANFGNGVSLSSAPNANRDFFLAKFDSAGLAQWAIKDGGTAIEEGFSLAIGPTNTYLCSGYFSIRTTFGGTNYLSSGPADAFMAEYAPNGALLDFAQSGSIGMELSRAVAYSPTGQTYMGGSFTDSITVDGVTETSQGGYDLFLMEFSREAAQIQGEVWFDQNANGQRDPADPGEPSSLIQIDPTPYYGLTGPSGAYSVYTDTGNYIVRPSSVLYHTWVPDSIPVSLPAYNLIDTASFGLQPIPGIQDLQVFLYPMGALRPGFATNYMLSYKNIGTVPISSGTVTLTLDPAISLNSATPAPTQSTSPQNHQWDYTNLLPQQTRYIFFNATTNSLTPLGVSLYNTARIYPVVGDTVPEDNRHDVFSPVVGSYDPNDKAVDPPGLLFPAQAAAQQPLTYKIRFQNTGTDTAFRVIVRDTLDPNLQWNTFDMIAASHPYQVSLGNDGALEWRFDNILLPDSNVNEPASHGFILYKMKPQATLQIGDEIHNSASIYFDFNVPVITNTVVTPIDTLVEAPLLLAPMDNLQDIPVNQVNLIWRPIGQPASFEIQLATNPGFTTGVLTATTSASQLSPTGLIPNQTYYWRVKAHDNGTQSPWSVVWQFNTDSAALDQVVHLSPADLSDNHPLSGPVLEWTVVPFADQYEYQLATSPNFSSVQFQDTVAQPYAQPNGLAYFTEYYWRVRGIDSASTIVGPWSDYWALKTLVPPPAIPILVHPADLAASQSTFSTLLDWNPVLAATQYDLLYTDNPTWQSGVTTLSLPPTLTTHSLPGLPHNTWHYWTVRSHVGNMASDWSDTLAFLTEFPSPTPLFPADATTGLDLMGTQLTWSTVLDAPDYVVQLSEDPNFTNIILSDTGGGASLTLPILANQSTYHWRVSAWDALTQNTSPWSTVWQFSTGDSLTSIPPVAPSEEPFVYPNPSTGLFYLNQLPPSTEDWQGTVFDTQGKLLHTFTLKKNPQNTPQQIRLTELPAGNYLLQLNNSELDPLRFQLQIQRE